MPSSSLIRIYKEKVEIVYIDVNTESVEFALDVANQTDINNFIYDKSVNNNPENQYKVSKIVKI